MEPPAETRLAFRILPQPDETTCGPTCLEAVYHYYRDQVSLRQLIVEVPSLPTGGTLAVCLACHALRRGYRARIYTCNLQVFDPSWFSARETDIRTKLQDQARHKHSMRLQAATSAYLEFLELGGELRLEDLSGALLRRYLHRGIPIITGLSATWLYRSAREFGPNCDYDDVRGEPSGHFVVLHGYDRQARIVHVADPLKSNPLTGKLEYAADINRLIGAIQLGVLTHDANLLIIQPPKERKKHASPNSHRG